MGRKIFIGVLLFATLIIILVLCMAISPEGREAMNSKKLKHIEHNIKEGIYNE